jgi:hypothetical protein
LTIGGLIKPLIGLLSDNDENGLSPAEIAANDIPLYGVRVSGAFVELDEFDFEAWARLEAKYCFIRNCDLPQHKKGAIKIEYSINIG